ncbi:MAG: hypothetical protein AB4042_12415 [Leptolyngbyaceae cyanobacterium]
METVFPTQNGYAGFFLVGYRKDFADRTERVGTAVLKRTYAIDSASGKLSPVASMPVFLQDQRDNLVLNSDFEYDLFDNEDNSLNWHPNNVLIERVQDPHDEHHHWLQVRGERNGSVTQTLAFEQNLGGRQFTFSFYATAAPVPARLESVQLEAGDSAVTCTISADMISNTNLTRFWASGSWPSDLKQKAMRVVLRTASEPATAAIFYDRVQVEERDYVTRWDPATTLRYEHDLAPFKPEADVIVLGWTDIAGTVRVKVKGKPWLERDIALEGASESWELEKAMFGWEPRVGTERETEAGPFPEEPEAYPLSDPLPSSNNNQPGFSNRFYNGYHRSGAIPAELPFPYLPRMAQIQIERDQGRGYHLSLLNERVSATYYYYTGMGLDEASQWKSQVVPMNLDTLVVEPTINRCYLVWRGAWPFDRHPEDAYRRLVVTAST